MTRVQGMSQSSSWRCVAPASVLLHAVLPAQPSSIRHNVCWRRWVASLCGLPAGCTVGWLQCCLVLVMLGGGSTVASDTERAASRLNGTAVTSCVRRSNPTRWGWWSSLRRTRTARCSSTASPWTTSTSGRAVRAPPLRTQLCQPFAGSGDTRVSARAEDTIITWSDPEIGTDIALSFQEAVGCNHIWCARLPLAAVRCTPRPAVQRLSRVGRGAGSTCSRCSRSSSAPRLVRARLLPAALALRRVRGRA